jgi:hypothetical protein
VKRLVLFALALALVTGCKSRYLMTVADGPSEGAARTTVLSTFDATTFLGLGMAKYVFWECQEEGDGLVCEKRCDVKDDQGEKVECQKFQIVN